MRRVNFTEICIVLIMVSISLIVNIFSGYYIKITNSQIIDNSFYTSKAVGINIKSEDKSFNIRNIEDICRLNDDFILYKSLSNGGQNNDVRGVYYSGDINIPPMLEGNFLKEKDSDNNSKYAVVGAGVVDNIVEIENKKYYDYYGEKFEIMGIIGVNRPSDLDSMVLLSLNSVINASGINGIYVVDGKSQTSIEKMESDLCKTTEANVQEIELDLGSTGLGLNFILVYILTSISLMASATLILYYYIEREKKKIAIKKLCGVNNKELIKELIYKQFVLVLIGFLIGTNLFVIFKGLFEIENIKIFNILAGYGLVVMLNLAILITPIKKILTIDISILLK